jgi:peroxiredoxin Q/BCP
MVETGDKAPEFTLKDQDDMDLSLSDLRGRWVVLYFYPRDNTSGCTKEACDFSERLDEFERLDAVVLGVSPDSTASHRKFRDKHGLRITLLSDPDKKVLKAYGAWGEKKNYGRVYEGVIRSTFIIDPDGMIAASWRNVRVRTKRKGQEVRHADLVKEELEKLQRERG